MANVVSLLIISVSIASLYKLSGVSFEDINIFSVTAHCKTHTNLFNCKAEECCSSGCDGAPRNSYWGSENGLVIKMNQKDRPC